MEWLSNEVVTVFSILFGTGSVGYIIISKILDHKRYIQEVREAEAEADIKSDEFWKNRYDILQKELESKENWWKNRYDTLYVEYQNERKLSNEIIITFRTELAEIRQSYEEQREIERKKYEQLLEQYKSLKEDSKKREAEYKRRINQLELTIIEYEQRLNKKE